MGAVAWGAVVTSVALGALAVGLVVWRRRRVGPPDELVVELAAIEAEGRATDLAFDDMIGHLLLSDPTFADSATRLTGQDDTGPA